MRPTPAPLVPPPLQLPGPLYHDALGGDAHRLGYLSALVTVRVVVFLEYPFQLLQLVWKKTWQERRKTGASQRDHGPRPRRLRESCNRVSRRAGACPLGRCVLFSFPPLLTWFQFHVLMRPPNLPLGGQRPWPCQRSGQDPGQGDVQIKRPPVSWAHIPGRLSPAFPDTPPDLAESSHLRELT